MTDDNLQELRRRVDAAVVAAMEKELTEKRMAVMHKELTDVLRELSRAAIARRREELVRRVEEWITANIDPLVELTARQMVDEALGEVKRRVLGRK